MPVVVATVGFDGYRMADGPWKGVWEAQMAVGDPKQHPEFAGTVASVDTRDFWREVEESPRRQDYHYNRNAETYLLVGEAMGRAMVRLQGGQAEAIPKSDREARTAAEVAAEAAKPVPTAEQKAASLAAIKPMILDGALAAFVNNPRYQPRLQAAIKGEKPARVSPLLNDTLDEAADYYRAAGIRDYDWKPFGGEMKDATWDYFSFDLPKAQPDPKAKGIPVAPGDLSGRDGELVRAGLRREEGGLEERRGTVRSGKGPDHVPGMVWPQQTQSAAKRCARRMCCCCARPSTCRR